jgi:amino acid permease
MFLAEMSTVASLVCWVTICGTYLRWRAALQKQKLERMVDGEAALRGQPYLAIYGFCASIILGMDLSLCKIDLQ